jgi:serine/threonine protein kinase
MMGVRDYPKNREEDNGQEGGVGTNWLGRCLEDRFEIGAVVAQTDLVAIHEANTVDDGAPLLATIYKGLELDDAGLEVLHHHLGALREGGYEPACGMVQMPEGFVVFERAPNGCALSSYLKKQESVTTANALVIGGQILASLDALHDIGQVSHSLAPHSIWIDDSGERLVCAVTRLGQQSLLGLINAKTRSDGACYAFPSYLMPEAVSGRELTPASDIYCAGLVLYELLAGRAAFAGDDFKKVARKHALERPLNPRIVNRQAKLSSELDRAIMKALEKTVKRRHESAMAFFEVLKSTAEGADVWSAGSATVVVEDTVEPAGEVMETLMMGSLASEGGTDESLASIAVATTADAFPESSAAAADASNTAHSNGQTQPFSSTLTRSVLAGMAENKREKEKAAGGVETQSERSPSRSSKPKSSSNEPQHGEVAFAENADWYADSLEQYESKTAHYDPYELEGEDRDRNLLPKILLGVVVSTVVIFLAISGLSGSESDTQQITKKDAAKTEQVTQSKTAKLVAAKTDKTAADKTAADKTAADKTAADKTAADKTAADKTAADKTAADKTAADKTAADKAAADKTAADKTAADKAAADKAAADKAAADKAAADKAAKAAKAKIAKAAADKAAKAAANAKAVSTKSMTAKPLAAKAKKPVASKASLTDKQATAVVEAKERAKREAAERKTAEKRQREAKAATALSEGSKLLKQGKYVLAKTKFMTALKASGLGPRGIATARAGLGAIEYESANFSGSVKQYKISVGKYKRNADRWYLLARSYYRLGNKVDARKSLDKALALKSNHTKAKKLLKRVQP